MSGSYPASYSPLLLQSQITLQAGTAGGAIGLADPTRLENPFQGPMWLDEIRIRLPTSGVIGRAWSSVSMKLELGNLPLTKSFVPVSLFGKVLNDSLTAEHMALTDGGSVNAFLPDLFTWKLPKPLYIPAREYLKPTLSFLGYDGAVSPSTQVGTICYACRPLPVGTPTPTTLQLPWVAAFVPPFLDTFTEDRIDTSTPADLYNPWDQDLHVQRFVGRFMGEADYGEEAGNMTLASAEVDRRTGLVPVGTLITAQDSFNNILIRDPTPFQHVFDMVDRAWTVNCILPPKGFYLFSIERLWLSYTFIATATVGISMVGWREVNFQT